MGNPSQVGGFERLDEIMRSTVSRRQPHSTLLVCFFTGLGVPDHCAAMRRDPAPSLGAPVRNSFHHHIDDAIALNPAVHDGAVIIGRDYESAEYEIRGWSFRLFPPATDVVQQANRGSAFNSGAAMSSMTGIDAVYLFSQQVLTRFVCGAHLVLP